MNLQPTIFISSIISEFHDLRGALRYFLGKSGFRVLTSEEPDFGADCDKDSLDNCKSRIDLSDYYFLIIGSNPGFEFELDNGEKTTVTLEEFKYFLELKNAGKPINLIAFVRQHTWDLYTKSDNALPDIQRRFIDLLLNDSLMKKEIGRWRYSFNSFQDIITVLETNQNGLFLDANRKKGVYRAYLKTELARVLKSLLIEKDGKILTYQEFINIPERKFGDLLVNEKIPRLTAVHMKTFIQVSMYKEELLLKINRIFNYIAQGEFSYFDPDDEKYKLPEYIKATIQALEILEFIFIKFQRVDTYKRLANLDVDDYVIGEMEYSFVRGQLIDINIATKKIINVLKCLNNNWSDFTPQDDEFYEYRGGANNIKLKDVVEFAEDYFKEKKEK